MNAERELWTWVDRRTLRRVSLTSTYTREQAFRQLAAWRRRDANGGRPDLHEIMPYVVVARVDWDKPGYGIDPYLFMDDDHSGNSE